MTSGAAFVLAALLAASASCDSRKPVLSIDDVIGRIDALNGETVRVGGFLPSCMGYDCGLYRSEAEARRSTEMLRALAKHQRLKDEELPEMLGIGGDEDFDRKAAPFVGRYVLITGTVDNRCRYHGKLGCTDRAPEIHPKAIEAWRPPSQGTRVPEKTV